MKPSAATMFKNHFLMMLTWCFVGFASRLLEIFTRIVTHFGEKPERERMSSYQQNRSSFQLDYRLTSSIYPISIRQPTSCDGVWRVINWSIARFIALFLFASSKRFAKTYPKSEENKKCWKLCFLKELRLTCKKIAVSSKVQEEFYENFFSNLFIIALHAFTFSGSL